MHPGGRALSLTATITCPTCGALSEKAVPEDACVFFFECPACQTLLRPLAGDCCVFCSYGDRTCPSRGSRPLEREPPR